MSVEAPSQLALFTQATARCLSAFLLTMVRDRGTADELTQSTFAEVLGHPGFDPNRPDAIGFLKRKARWLAQDHYRRQKRVPQALPAGLTDFHSSPPDEAAERQEVCQRVRAAIARLSPAHQAVLLRTLRGQDYRTIAAELRLPIQTVRSRFHHGKNALRKLLGDDGWALL
jgi:RNA polymerase sigma factor (sigma-70 family)